VNATQSSTSRSLRFIAETAVATTSIVLVGGCSTAHNPTQKPTDTSVQQRGATVVMTLSSNPKTRSERSPALAQTQVEAPTIQPGADLFYQNCSVVRAAGRDPLYRGDPGYRSKLDRDNDGIACE